MPDRATSDLAAQLAALVEAASADRIAAAREDGYRAGYIEGRREARVEMNERLRALIYNPGDEAFAPKKSDPAPARVADPPAPAPSPPAPPPPPPPAEHAPPPPAVDEPRDAEDDTSSTRLPPDWRTDERKAEFIKRYRAGQDMNVIRLALGDMPGARVPEKNAPLWTWVAALNLRRDGGAPESTPPPPPAAPPARPAASHPSIAPPGPRPAGTNPLGDVAKLPPPSEDGKIYASFAEIRAWAGAYNIAYDGTQVDRINKLRAAKSLPPLVQRGP